MILSSEINPASFVLLFEKGSSGTSFSVRDYSRPHNVVERYARDFASSAKEIRRRATVVLDAPFIETTRLAEWHTYTTELNRRYNLPSVTVQTISDVDRNTFPLLNRDGFEKLPKSGKTIDLHRMLFSPQSEDWVTWNALMLLVHALGDAWWPHLLHCAQRNNAILQNSLRATAKPQLHFWRQVESPPAYEQASRSRMRASGNPEFVARSDDPRPVEGKSEIDVVIEDDSVVVYVEAKLGADISMRTTYDPCRNQIVRNIDCLIEAAAGREALFWMFVRDTSPSRAYVQIMEEYRRNPRILMRDLPHRRLHEVEGVAHKLAIMTWRDIAGGACVSKAFDDEVIVNVKDELKRRIDLEEYSDKA